MEDDKRNNFLRMLADRDQDKIYESFLEANRIKKPEPTPKFKAIMCVDSCLGYASNGTIPWHSTPAVKRVCKENDIDTRLLNKDLSNDLSHFKHVTTGQNVVMGRGTYESLVSAGVTLRNRVYHIFTRHPQNIATYNNFVWREKHQLMSFAQKYPNKDFWVIGGASIIEMFLDEISEIHLSKIYADFDCDKFLTQKILGRLDGMSYVEMPTAGAHFNLTVYSKDPFQNELEAERYK